VLKVDLRAQVFTYTIDEERLRYLELLDGKLLLVTNTEATATEVVQRYKSLADIERGFRVLSQTSRSARSITGCRDAFALIR
jgi:hypothetical protein